MGSTPRLYNTLVYVCSQHQNWVDLRHLKTLAWMIVGLIQSGKISLTAWTPYVHSRAVYAQSIVRRFARWLENDRGTISSSISRDLVRRTRMTTRRSGGRNAVTHYEVQRRINSPYGKFTLLRLQIETGRTHQIRVHMASMGHPVVGDTAYGAPAKISRGSESTLSLPRNFLHAAEFEFDHPRTGEHLTFSRPLPESLEQFLERLR